MFDAEATATGPADPSSAESSQLSAQEKARRAKSFGSVATHYQRFRPGPPQVAVDWILPDPVARVVDLGAGTGALSRLLLEKADEVVAVEPDDRMRAVLNHELPEVRAVVGRGEAIPLPDGSADAAVASSSWHWMDPVPTLNELGRILVPGGIFAVLASGPDPDGTFLSQARALLGRQRPTPGGTGGAPGDAARDELASVISGETGRNPLVLEIPPGRSFGAPDHESFRWDVSLNADELIGLLGTFSWIITMPEEQRSRVVGEARRLLSELLGVDGEVTVDVDFRCEVWKTKRHR